MFNKASKINSENCFRYAVCVNLSLSNKGEYAMKFQVVSVTPKAGIAKSNKPYSMLVVDGILTDTDGVMSTCESVFFVEAGRPAPVLVPGQTYEPVVKVGVSRDKKLTAYIETMVPIRAVSAPKAA